MKRVNESMSDEKKGSDTVARWLSNSAINQLMDQLTLARIVDV